MHQRPDTIIAGKCQGLKPFGGWALFVLPGRARLRLGEVGAAVVRRAPTNGGGTRGGRGHIRLEEMAEEVRHVQHAAVCSTQHYLCAQ
jgi:hypothetical protein